MASNKATIGTLIDTNLASGSNITAIEHREVEDALNDSNVNTEETAVQTLKSPLRITDNLDGGTLAGDTLVIDATTEQSGLSKRGYVELAQTYARLSGTDTSSTCQIYATADSVIMEYSDGGGAKTITVDNNGISTDTDIVVGDDKTITTEASATATTTQRVYRDSVGEVVTVRTSSGNFDVYIEQSGKLSRIKNSAGTVVWSCTDAGDVINYGDLSIGGDKKVIFSVSSGAHTIIEMESPSGKILEIEGNDTNTWIRNNVGSVIFSTALGTSAGVYGYSSHASYTGSVVLSDAVRASSAAFNLLLLRANAGADDKMKCTGAGEVTADGSFTGGGADYAEYFEWADGNPDNEDRVGVSVKLVGNQIAIAEDGDTFLGVISGNPSVVGDGDMGWKKKYLTDDFGRKVLEDYQVIDWTQTKTVDGKKKTIPHSYEIDKIPEGVTVPKSAVIKDMVGKDGRPVLNPDYSDEFEYIHRQDRKEWDTVGLVGKLRIKNDQAISPSWIKMRDISETVSEYFIK